MAADMSKKSGKEGLTFDLARFLVENRMVVIVSLVLVVVLIFGLIGFFVWRDGVRKEAIVHAEKINEAYIDWLRAEEGARDDKEKIFLELTAEARKRYPKSFAMQRALFSEALFHVEKKDYLKAAGLFTELADKFGESYLAPEGYYNAASAFEMANDHEKAIGSLEKLLEKYRDDSPLAPEACFNIGRLHDTAGRKDQAIDYFEKLLADYPGSEWSGVAQTRIIELKTGN